MIMCICSNNYHVHLFQSPHDQNDCENNLHFSMINLTMNTPIRIYNLNAGQICTIAKHADWHLAGHCIGFHSLSPSRPFPLEST